MVESVAAHKSFAELIAGNEPVLIDFYSDWVGPCKVVKPVLEQVKQRLGEKVIILKIDVDKNPKVAKRYNIHSVPTLMLFKNNVIKWRQTGVAPPHAIEKIIRENL